MKHWEYLIRVIPGTTIEMQEEALTVFGAAGWEICAIVNQLVYFKREIISKGGPC
jgi:hypothetical protein